jgi:hypothetical protein
MLAVAILLLDGPDEEAGDQAPSAEDRFLALRARSPSRS